MTDDKIQTRAREADVYIAAIRAGATEREAAAKAGVPRSAMASRVRADEALAQREEEARVAYLDEVRGHVEKIAAGDFEDARAAAVQVSASTWLLSKRDPDRFGQRSKQDVAISGGEGGPVQVERVLSPEERVRELEEIARLASEAHAALKSK